MVLLSKYNLNPVFPQTLKVDASKGSKVSFQFRKNGKQVVNNVLLYIEGSKPVPAKPYVDAAGLYSIDYLFTSKGKFTVHILLNDQYAVTYIVGVR